MLYGLWREDLTDRLFEGLGTERAQAWGRPDMSSNVLASVCSQLAILHDQEPVIGHADADAARRMTELLKAALWSPQQQTVTRDVVGLREMLVLAQIHDATTDAPYVAFEPVFPDLVVATPHPKRPDTPARIVRAYRCKDGKWGTETYDPLAVGGPVYVIEKNGRDVTVEELGASFSGDAYPFVNGAGAPILPFVLYHAQKGGTLWDPWALTELVDGTLQSAMHYSHVNHVMQDASHPQRWIAGGTVAGVVVEKDSRRVVTMDATTVAEIQADENTNGGVQVGQWLPGGDPEAMLRVADSYFARVATQAGISPSDFKRVGGDARSGYALEISDAGKRAAAKKLRPTIEAGDLATISLVAQLWNGLGLQPALPEAGWTITYPALQPSATELKARLDMAKAMREAGLIDRVEEYALIRDVDMETARIRLAELDAERAAAAEAEGAADAPLAGIVMREAREIAKDVAAGTLSREAGAALIAEGLRVPEERALRLLGPAGFRPATEGT
jgi:hypothetical protein